LIPSRHVAARHPCTGTSENDRLRPTRKRRSGFFSQRQQSSDCRRSWHFRRDALRGSLLSRVVVERDHPPTSHRPNPAIGSRGNERPVSLKLQTWCIEQSNVSGTALAPSVLKVSMNTVFCITRCLMPSLSSSLVTARLAGQTLRFISLISNSFNYNVLNNHVVLARCNQYGE